MAHSMKDTRGMEDAFFCLRPITTVDQMLELEPAGIFLSVLVGYGGPIRTVIRQTPVALPLI
jgi:hypothetical protein